MIYRSVEDNQESLQKTCNHIAKSINKYKGRKLFLNYDIGTGKTTKVAKILPRLVKNNNRILVLVYSYNIAFEWKSAIIDQWRKDSKSIKKLLNDKSIYVISSPSKMPIASCCRLKKHRQSGNNDFGIARFIKNVCASGKRDSSGPICTCPEPNVNCIWDYRNKISEANVVITSFPFYKRYLENVNDFDIIVFDEISNIDSIKSIVLYKNPISMLGECNTNTITKYNRLITLQDAVSRYGEWCKPYDSDGQRNHLEALQKGFNELCIDFQSLQLSGTEYLHPLSPSSSFLQACKDASNNITKLIKVLKSSGHADNRETQIKELDIVRSRFQCINYIFNPRKCHQVYLLNYGMNVKLLRARDNGSTYFQNAYRNIGYEYAARKKIKLKQHTCDGKSIAYIILSATNTKRYVQCLMSSPVRAFGSNQRNKYNQVVFYNYKQQVGGRSRPNMKRSGATIEYLYNRNTRERLFNVIRAFMKRYQNEKIIIAGSKSFFPILARQFNEGKDSDLNKMRVPCKRIISYEEFIRNYTDKAAPNRIIPYLHYGISGTNTFKNYRAMLIVSTYNHKTGYKYLYMEDPLNKKQRFRLKDEDEYRFNTQISSSRQLIGRFLRFPVPGKDKDLKGMYKVIFAYHHLDSEYISPVISFQSSVSMCKYIADATQDFKSIGDKNMIRRSVRVLPPFFKLCEKYKRKGLTEKARKKREYHYFKLSHIAAKYLEYFYGEREKGKSAAQIFSTEDALFWSKRLKDKNRSRRNKVISEIKNAVLNKTDL